MVDFAVAPSAIREIRFFDSLTAEEARQAAAALSPVQYQQRDTIFRQGDASDTCYVLVQGAVEITCELPGGAHYSLATLTAHDVFGEMSLLADQRRSATAIAQRDCLMWRLMRHSFEDALESNATWAYKVAVALARVLAARLAAVDREMIDLIARCSPDAAASAEAAPARTASHADELERLRAHLLGINSP